MAAVLLFQLINMAAMTSFENALYVLSLVTKTLLVVKETLAHASVAGRGFSISYHCSLRERFLPAGKCVMLHTHTINFPSEILT